MADAVPNAKIISNAGTFLLGFLRLTADKYLPLHGSQRPPSAMAGRDCGVHVTVTKAKPVGHQL